MFVRGVTIAFSVGTLAQVHPNHAGIVVSPPIGWGTSQLIRAIDRMLTETSAEEWIGQVRWLKQWR